MVGVNYYEIITFRTSGTAVFQALPTSILAMVENTNLVNGFTEVVSIARAYYRSFLSEHFFSFFPKDL